MKHVKHMDEFVPLNESVRPGEVVPLTFDNRDVEGAIESFKEALARFNIFLYEDPEFEGSDMYGFFLSKEKMTKSNVNQISKSLHGEE